jgi:methionyl aminopeptidase
VVKLDVGAHVNGYIADTAITVELETRMYDSMIKASSDALEQAINVLHAGVLLSDVGETIETAVTAHGFKPIDNLMGHGLNRFELHSGL